MPARSKIVDESEVIHWFEDGWTYTQMVDTYRDRYNLEVTPTMFSNFRSRRGLERRVVRDDRLIPWDVKRQHRWAYPLAMLRVEARIRAGRPVAESLRAKHDAFFRELDETQRVVYYDPETVDGFFLVPREPRDADYIREPPPGLRTRKPAGD